MPVIDIFTKKKIKRPRGKAFKYDPIEKQLQVLTLANKYDKIVSMVVCYQTESGKVGKVLEWMEDTPFSMYGLLGLTQSMCNRLETNCLVAWDRENENSIPDTDED